MQASANQNTAGLQVVLLVCVLAAIPTARSLGSVRISLAGARHWAGRASRASNFPVSLRKVA